MTTDVINHQALQLRLVTQLRPYYDQPHRHYHTTDHIAQMFLDAAEVGWMLYMEEHLAIAFHDAVWIPGEDKASVRLSMKLLKTTYQSGELDWVIENHCYRQHGNDVIYIPSLESIVDSACAIIADTHKHIPHSTDFDSSRVIDLDLYGLCQKDRQETINAQLRKEFPVTDVKFVQGRIAFMKGLLDRSPFYYNLSPHEDKLALNIVLDELKALMLT